MKLGKTISNAYDSINHSYKDVKSGVRNISKSNEKMVKTAITTIFVAVNAAVFASFAFSFGASAAIAGVVSAATFCYIASKEADEYPLEFGMKGDAKRFFGSVNRMGQNILDRIKQLRTRTS